MAGDLAAVDVHDLAGVWITPGETALTRMPREAYSMASDLVAAARIIMVTR